MKRTMPFILSFLFFILFCSGCSKVIDEQVEAIDFDSLEYFINANNPDWVFEPSRMSPDFKWFVSVERVDYKDDFELVLLSTDGSLKISLPLSGADGMYLPFIYNWSPDSKSVIVVYSDYIRDTNKIIVFHLENDNEIKQYVYHFSEPDFIRTVWSDDSNHIAIYYSNSHVYILDRECTLINAISFSDDIEMVYKSVWPGFAVEVEKQDPSGEAEFIMEIREYTDILNSNEYEVIFSEPDTSYRILAMNKADIELILDVCPADSYLGSDCSIQAYNLIDNELSFIAEFPYPIWQVEKSAEGNLIGIITQNKQSPPPFTLLTLNMDSYELREERNIYAMLGWSSSEKGFIVIQVEDGTDILEVVTPN